MQFQHVISSRVELDPKLTWIWYSEAMRSFIVGDEKTSFALATEGTSAPAPLAPERPFKNDGHSPARNLPIPATLYDEFAQSPWHGFRFIDAAHCELPVDGGKPPAGDLVRTLVFGLDYGHLVLHPPSGLVLSLKGGSLQLLRLSETGFTALDKTKTRGRAALAFAGHPSEPLIVYGDNYGDFHAHRFTDTKFGKANKIASKERKASRIAFLQDGRLLMIGGMGYLSSYSYIDGKFAPLHDVSISVRDFVVLNDGETVLVNQGMHGLAAYKYDANGFSKLATTQPGGAIQQVAVSSDGKFLAITIQDDPMVTVYAIS